MPDYGFQIAPLSGGEILRILSDMVLPILARILLVFLCSFLLSPMKAPVDLNLDFGDSAPVRC